jgi:enoyl-[acyl-carrier protein] reductase II
MPPPTGVANIERAIARVSPYYAELGLPPPATPAAQAPPFDEQLAASIESGAAALSFTFGLLPNDAVARVKARGMMLIGTATSVEEAVALEAAGVDAVVAVGTEAGGHPPPDEVGSLVVVRAVVKAVSIPVIGGGGIADGAGIAAMLCLGADGVQLGTRFLLTPESNLHKAYKARALAAGIADTTLIGRGRLPIRVLKNDFTREFEAAERTGAPAEDLATLNASRTLKMAAFEGDVDRGKLEVGQSVGLIDELVPAGELVQRLIAEFETAVERLSRFRD